jgi:arginase family enzyme
VQVRVIDLDGVGDQASITARNPVIVPARDLAPRLRLWAGRRALAELAERIEASDGSVVTKSVTFLGSGDFHNVAPLLIARAEGPVTVVHVDNHPDWTHLAPRGHCGAWVNRALELRSVVKVITIGPTSSDLDHPDLRGGAFEALRDGRVEIFPWDRLPSRIVRKLTDGPGHTVRNGKVVWRCLADEDWTEVCRDLIDRVPPEAKVWFSIDKDVLGPKHATTNWDQGQMPLDALTDLIAAFGDARCIAGADVCGDWTPPAYDTVLKAWEARLDQPRTPPGDISVNARTNARLLEVFAEVMG